MTLSLMCIVLYALAAMWTDPEDSGTRLGHAVTLVLALAAVKFVVASDLPRVPYLTALDKVASVPPLVAS